MSIFTQNSVFYKIHILITIFTLSIFTVIIFYKPQPVSGELITPVARTWESQTVKPKEKSYEVLGFAPYWMLQNLSSVNFSVLKTLAYFDLPISAQGSIDTSSNGYQSFFSPAARDLFTQARKYNTKIIATFTQMDNETIRILLQDDYAKTQAIEQITQFVSLQNLDGVNIDFEYVGNIDSFYRNAFSNFISQLSVQLHKQNPNAIVSVSVYANSARDPKLFDLPKLATVADSIFMMAYDFATYSSVIAMPTAPLYGYKEGQYWYDVSSAVHDFLNQIPAEKLILGVPYYSYNYTIVSPDKIAKTKSSYWGNSHYIQIYAESKKNITSNSELRAFTTGWDDLGQVRWYEYIDEFNRWRKVYVEDQDSLAAKYDFAKKQNLQGVGIWALGFDHNTSELWDLLSVKFGVKRKYS